MPSPSEAQAQIERCRRVDVALVDRLVKLGRAATRQIVDAGRELEGVTGARAAVDVEAAERQAVPYLDVRHAVERVRHHALRGVLDVGAQELDRDAQVQAALRGLKVIAPAQRDSIAERERPPLLDEQRAAQQTPVEGARARAHCPALTAELRAHPRAEQQHPRRIDERRADHRAFGFVGRRRLLSWRSARGFLCSRPARRQHPDRTHHDAPPRCDPPIHRVARSSRRERQARSPARASPRLRKRNSKRRARRCPSRARGSFSEPRATRDIAVAVRSSTMAGMIYQSCARPRSESKSVPAGLGAFGKEVALGAPRWATSMNQSVPMPGETGSRLCQRPVRQAFAGLRRDLGADRHPHPSLPR